MAAEVIGVAASTERFDFGTEEVRRSDGLELEAAGQFDLYGGTKRVGIPPVREPKNRSIERHHIQYQFAVPPAAKRRTLSAVLPEAKSA